MIRFLARRLLTALGLLLVLSVMMYGLLSIAMDPLDDLRISTALNKQDLINGRIRALHLDWPWYRRYASWLYNVVQGDFGMAWRTQQHVKDILPGAVKTSVQLVFAATVLALLIGVTIGVISALRQYTSFDYAITFVSFVLYSLPVFWVAVLLKQFLAIGLNDYLAKPHIMWPLAIGLSVLSGLFWAGVLGGNTRRKLITFAIGFAAALAALLLIMGTNWINEPQLGPLGIAIIGLAAAFGFTALFAGMHNRRALYSALTTAVVGVVTYLGLRQFFDQFEINDGILWVLLLIALVIGAAIGFLWGGPDRGVSVRGGMLVALIMSVAVWIDQLMWNYPVYFSKLGGRPIPTMNTSTPNLTGDYWIMSIDKITHLVLPTIALVMISFAGYVRYERGAMLEVLGQDYIRTARSKGLPERVVIVRHALRNALMPLASIVPPDFIAMIGGAVITETIFGWRGMGRMFIDGLRGSEADPVMIYVMITGGLAMVANLLADLLYALLDPRIRVNA
ncbi:ABC transporter permease [Aestuariimicrobium soli]|uniref:ABC transporter permease n=1 Tax=Aestuariimicrobium soli TaxID=2035834 RepID=UPI003EC0C0BA